MIRAERSTAEPTGFIFTGTGEEAFVTIQHRSTNTGALLKISGFRVRDRHDDDRD